MQIYTKSKAAAPRGRARQGGPAAAWYFLYILYIFVYVPDIFVYIGIKFVLHLYRLTCDTQTWWREQPEPDSTQVDISVHVRVAYKGDIFYTNLGCWFLSF